MTTKPADSTPGWEQQFIRSPEQIARDKLRLEAEIERERAKAEAGDDPLYLRREQSSDPRPLGAILDSTLARLRVWDADRQALACVRAMWPEGAPEGYLSVAKSRPGYSRLLAGKEACDAAGAAEGCPYAVQADFCAQDQVQARREEIRSNLLDAGVQQREYDVIMASISSPRVPLIAYDTLRVVRQFLAGERLTLGGLENAAEIEPLTGKQQPDPRFTGNDKLLVMGGNTGRGKSVAACYAISKAGGLYLREYAFSETDHRRAPDLDEIEKHRGVVVIDQVGRAAVDQSRTAIVRLEGLIDARCAAGRRSILVGNFDFQTFSDRYKKIMLERIAGFGLLVLFGGESLRPAMRHPEPGDDE